MRARPFRFTYKILVVALAGLVYALLPAHPRPVPSVSVGASAVRPAAGEFFSVVKVVDGDTIELSNGEKVRFIGIDCPESAENLKLNRDAQKTHQDKKTILAMGKRAKAFTRSLLQGQAVRLEFDVTPRDRYGRLLAYVYLTDGTFVNARIIQEGFASPMTIPPNVKYAKTFALYYRDAQDQQLGLWND